jgi:hypothetical protein
MGAWNIKEILKTSPRGAYYLPTELEVYLSVESVGYWVFKVYEIRRAGAKFDSDNMIGAEEELLLTVITIDLYQYPTYILFKLTLPLVTTWIIPTQNENKWQHKILKNLHIPDVNNLHQSLTDPDSTIYI